MTELAAASEQEAIAAIRAAREWKTPFDITAAGTKRGFGRPVSASTRLDVSQMRGIVAYEPEELILTVRPATSVAEIEDVLAERGQRLGFDPVEWGALFGASGQATLGGVVSADACGPARVRYGAVRDHLLGLRAVNGFGEAFKAGGKVVKNVTGFDIPKLFCGAFGTLGVLTELTFRVVPMPQAAATLVVRDVAPAQGFALLRRVWASALEATGLAYVPGRALAELGDMGMGAALIRVDGAPVPLKEKLAALLSLLAGCDAKPVEDGEMIFRMIGAGAVFAATPLDVWRVFVPPGEAASVAKAIAAPLWLGDWAGGLLWIGMTPGDDGVRLRAAAAQAGGSATLLRAEDRTRARVAVFPPQDETRAALTRAVKAAFDPLALFNPGRMYEKN